MGVGPALRRARRWRSSASSSPIRSPASSTTRSRAGTGSRPSEWVGLHNFQLLWSDPIFRVALRNNADLRALGADPGRRAADRRVRDPPARAGVAFLPRHHLPAGGVRDGRDRHPHRDGAAARRPAEPGARRGSGSTACKREWLGSATHVDPADPARRRLDELRLQRPALPRRHERDRPVARGGGADRRGGLAADPLLRDRAQPAARARDRARREHDHRLRVHVHLRLHDHERRARHRHLRVRVLHLPAGVHEPEHGLRGGDRRHARR